jgi:PTS system galactitol-specific IIB component
VKSAKIMTVCGSGVVTSSMVACKLKERLREHGFDIVTVETSPNGIESLLMGAEFDLMACISPVKKDYGIPKVNAIGMIAGLGDDQVVEDCLAILNKKIN